MLTNEWTCYRRWRTYHDVCQLPSGGRRRTPGESRITRGAGIKTNVGATRGYDRRGHRICLLGIHYSGCTFTQQKDPPAIAGE